MLYAITFVSQLHKMALPMFRFVMLRSKREKFFCLLSDENFTLLEPPAMAFEYDNLA